MFCHQPPCVSPATRAWLCSLCAMWPLALPVGDGGPSPEECDFHQQQPLGDSSLGRKLGEIQSLGDFSSWISQTFTWSWELALALR